MKQVLLMLTLLIGIQSNAQDSQSPINVNGSYPHNFQENMNLPFSNNLEQVNLELNNQSHDLASSQQATYLPQNSYRIPGMLQIQMQMNQVMQNNVNLGISSIVMMQNSFQRKLLNIMAPWMPSNFQRGINPQVTGAVEEQNIELEAISDDNEIEVLEAEKFEDQEHQGTISL